MVVVVLVSGEFHLSSGLIAETWSTGVCVWRDYGYGTHSVMIMVLESHYCAGNIVWGVGDCEAAGEPSRGAQACIVRAAGIGNLEQGVD
jgi:hypothetical protein